MWGFIDDYGIDFYLLQLEDEGEEAELLTTMIRGQVRDTVELLSCLKEWSRVSFYDKDGTLVTHGRSRWQDLPVD